MHGDFSRGHEPDRKRGRDYRRVLLQMGRPVLDSDVAASVDALLGQVRRTARGLGCAAGSPDLGFLVTPGRLLAVFSESADGVRVLEGTPSVWIDYRFRYLDRFPALFLAATGELDARVSIPSLQRLRPGGARRPVALWASVEQPTWIELNGVDLLLSPTVPDEPTRWELDLPASTLDPLEIKLPAGVEVWLFLLEEDEVAGDHPVFWVAPGTYHVDGLIVDAHGGGSFPAHGFPEDAGFPWSESPQADPPLEGLVAPPATVPGTQFVAYVEVGERHLTAVEDPGMREEALGAGDTSTRTELLGQVKLAVVNRSLPPDAIRDAFTRVEPSGAELTIEVASSTPVADPCALPDVAGYSGADNRLYRIEVHHGGPLAQLRLKWSRDNGAELFGAQLDGAGNLVFPAGSPLAAGDLVEVLSDVVDLGDDELARVEAAGLIPPRRAVGQLAQLAAVGEASSTDEVRFTLVNPDDTSLPVALDDRYGPAPAGLKVRRWHGILDPRLIAGAAPASPGPHPLEDGVTLLLSTAGFYRPGQYWQFEARVRQENANGPWRREPHGPERRFAPLALLEYQGRAQPLALVAWLDERFPPPCDLTADDVAFDGERVGSPSETVQEALEELFDQTTDWPVIVEGGLSWQNDRPLPWRAFQQGLTVVFSEEMHPACASLDTFVVTMEVPDEATIWGRRSLVLDGSILADGRVWTFLPTLDPGLLPAWMDQLGGPIRCRVRLIGDVILDRNGVRPLDGEAVGRVVEDGYDNVVDLALPSGNGVRGGDFQSWFYLTAPPERVTVDDVDPPADRLHPAGQGPATVVIGFSDAVRFATLTDRSVTVSRRHASDPPDSAEPILGRIQPYPFEVAPDIVTRITFAPDDPDALRRPEDPRDGAWIFTVSVRGTGDEPVLDLDGRGIDGGRTAGPSDFVSTFQVMAEQE